MRESVKLAQLSVYSSFTIQSCRYVFIITVETTGPVLRIDADPKKYIPRLILLLLPIKVLFSLIRFASKYVLYTYIL